MPTNFRLAYTNGIEYIDLFPSTSVHGITDANNVFEIVTLDVTIPAPTSQTLTQSIAITTTQEMEDTNFNVILLSTGTQAESDYTTISQMQVNTNELVVTRLYNMPVDSIDVRLVFFEQRGVV